MKGTRTMKKFTKEQINKARSIDTTKYLESKGFEFEPSESNMICTNHSDLTIRKDGSWYWTSQFISGNNVIDFLIDIDELSFIDAVETLLKGDYKTISVIEKVSKSDQPFFLPRQAINNQCVYRYLRARCGIDRVTISELLLDNKIYESAKNYHCIFVGFDEDGVPKYASRLGVYCKTSWKRFNAVVESSDSTCAFHMIGETDVLYVFETPIEVMSHASITKLDNEDDYEQVQRIALWGTLDGALKRFLQNNSISKIVFCLDNEDAEKSISEEYMRLYKGLGYQTSRERPVFGKDFNESLLYMININDKKDVNNE